MERLQHLLDDRRPEGVIGVRRALGPHRLAALVNRCAIADARVAIEELCLAWGGSTGFIVPHTPGESEIAEPWLEPLEEGVFDRLGLRGLLPEDKERRRGGVLESDHVMGESLLAIVVGQRRPREEWPVLDVALPAPDDPWYIAYLGALGSWPTQLEELQTGRAGLVPNAEPEDVIPIERGVVDAPGPAELIERLRTPGRITATTLCLHGLAALEAPRAGDFTSDPVFSPRGWAGREIGPNIVVVYEEDSVEDLCLLWNLRAVHRVPPALPFGTPVTAAPEALRVWSRVSPDPQVVRLWGVVQRPWALVSCSVGPERLAELATQAGAGWRPFDIREVAQGGDRPCRITTDTATFSDGAAQVAAFSPADRDFFEGRPAGAYGTDLTVRFQPVDRHLPPSRTLKRWLPILAGYQGGGAEFQASRLEKLLPLEWPSGFNVLRAVVRDRGFEARPSRPGRAATSLLQRLGSFFELQPLLSRQILDELYQLGERSGISYFKAQVRKLQDQLGGGGEEAANGTRIIERELAEMRLRPFEGEERDLTFDRLKNRIGAAAAREWLTWAEDRGLLVRGAAIGCPNCARIEWRVTSELAPPIYCRGCGRAIEHPFRPDTLPFRYRASQLLLDAIALDVLPHVLALRWLSQLLDGQALYGGHPGVEFLDPEGEVVGEADVVLVFSQGHIALGECKLSPAGLTEEEVAKHEALADQLDATWTFYATPTWAAECPSLWPELQRRLPERFRASLSAEQLLSPDPFWQAGTDPFAWTEVSEDDRDKHDREFVDGLPQKTARLRERAHLDQIILDEE